MKKNNDPENWADRLSPEAAVDPEAPEIKPAIDLAAEVRARDIQILVLRRALHRSRIETIDLELKALGVSP